MKIGVHLPQWGVDATRDGVLSVARAAEDAGLDSVWVADHLVHPVHTASTYPYQSGGTPFKAEDGFLEAFTLLATVAGATSRLQLGTSVFVLPMREPLQVAKTVATLDVLSEGRVLLGIGAGWWEEEFRALGATFARRGRRLDEQIAILRALWRDGRLEHHGEFYDFDEVVCEPRPVQPGGPPILVGGMGPPSWGRAGRLGDGWHAVGAHDETLVDGLAEVRKLAAEVGRVPEEMGLSTSALLPDDPEHAIRRLVRLARAGVDHVVLKVPEDTATETSAAIERLASEVVPEVRSSLVSTPE